MTGPWLHPPRPHRRPMLASGWVKALAAVVVTAAFYVLLTAVADRAITQAAMDAANFERMME